MESIKIGTNRVRLMMNDDKNKIVSFNPGDATTRKKFYDIQKTAIEKQKKLDIKIKAIKEDDVESAINMEIEAFDAMAELVDEIFGDKTSEKACDGDKDLAGICNFLIAVAPYFKKYNEDMKNKYVNNLKNNGVI